MGTNIFSFLRLLAKYITPYKWTALIILGSMLFEGVFESVMRFSFKFIIDEAIVPKNYGLLVLILSALGFGALLFTGFSFLGDFLWARFGTLVVNDIRFTMFNRVQTLSMEFFGRRTSGDILSCFLADAANVESSLVSIVPSAVVGLSNVVFSAILLFSLDLQLSVLTCIGFSASFILPRLVFAKATKEGYRQRQQEGQIGNVIQENLTSQVVIKMFGLEKQTSNYFNQELKEFFRIAVRANFLSYLVLRIPSAAFILVSLVVLGLGAVMSYSGKMSIGTLVSFQVLSLGLSGSVSNLTWVAPTVVDAIASMQRINEILAERPSVQDVPDAVELKPLSREIHFDRVAFGYSLEQKALKGVSFTIEKGQFAVFVGPSGAGKSSIINLLVRFYDPDAGKITFDGVDIRDVSQPSLRSQMGFVSQDVILFDSSIRENIRMGNLQATEEQIKIAAASAEIHDYIMTLPQGYDTPIGERGGRLSGGQRQRIALARALVRNPAILILDEATSALDPLNEAEILKTLQQLAKKRTVIAVSHRLNMALCGDVIFVMEQGCIAAMGNHTTLMEEGGLYASLWERGENN